MTPSELPMHQTFLVASDFRPLLHPLSLDILDAHDATIYGLRADLTLALVNQYWWHFATDNQGDDSLLRPDEVLDKPILTSMVGPDRDFYEDLYREVLADAQPRTHEYECSSPTEERFLHMSILPLPIGTDEPRGLLVINSCRTEPWQWPHDHPIHPKHHDDYITDDNQIIMCSTCQRTRHAQNPRRWDWVPDYLEDTPVAVSHGLCAICLDYYYPPSPEATSG